MGSDFIGRAEGCEVESGGGGTLFTLCASPACTKCILHQLLRAADRTLWLLCTDPGMQSSASAQQALRQYGIPLWDTEEFSTFSDETGALCWIRAVVDNYVNGYMTMTSSWYLVSGSYPSIPFWSEGMMTASEPWAGSYRINEQVWATAHFTQFTALGDRYLPHGAGTGKLPLGGSYVSLVDGRGGLTILVQKASHPHSLCEYKQNNAPFNTSSEYVTFQLRGGDLTNIRSLQLFRSLLLFNGSESTLFEKQRDVVVGLDGKIRLHVLVDSIYTLTNRGATAQKGRHAGTTPRKPTPFPLPYHDDFESCRDSREAKYWSDFSGAFECRDGMLWQMTPSTPIGWMHDVSAFSVIGSVQWEDISAAVDVAFASSGSMVAFGCLGVRVSNRGDMLHGMTNPDGLFLSVQRDRGNNRTSWAVANQNISGATVSSSAAASPDSILASGVLPVASDTLRLNITVVNNSLRVIIGHAHHGPMQPLLLDRSLHIAPGSAPSSGWVGIGSSWARVGFDNVHIDAAPRGIISRCLDEPSAGQTPVTVACGSVEALDGMRWDMEPGRADGVVKLRAENTSLCLQAIPAVPPSTSTSSVHLATCDRSNPRQHFLYDPVADLAALNPIFGSGGSTISHIPAAGVAPQCLTASRSGHWGDPTIVDPTAFSAVFLDTAACSFATALPASLFTWSPAQGFLVNHACASGNLCIGVCGSRAKRAVEEKFWGGEN